MAGLLALASGATEAGKKNDTVIWLTEFETPTYDFYAQVQREGVILSKHIWDTLVDVDPVSGEIKPHLATSVAFINPTTIEVKLRQGVKFHNGDPLTADDVVYTITWQNDPANTNVVARSRTSWIRQAEKVDPYTVRLHLHEPFAPAFAYLVAEVPIYPAAYTKANGSEGMSRAPVGTGPYKVTEVTRGKQIVLERNKDYFGGLKGQPRIGKIVMRVVPEYNTQIAELLSGNADFIWRIPKDQAERMKSRRGIKIMVGDTMRIGYMSFDITGRPGAQAEPLRKVEVRQAITHAINRKAIVDQMLGGGTVLDLSCYPSQIGCASKGAARYDYNPAKAKALLAKAGYPGGFEIDLYGNRDRQLAEAMMGDLAKVGIKVRLQMLQSAPLRDKVRKGEVPLSFRTWGSGSLNDAAGSTGYFFGKGPDNTTQDARVTELIRKADTEIDLPKRLALYDQAHKLIAQNAYWVPLWSYVYFYAMTDDLQFQPTPDEIPHLYRASWK
ncbi:MAG: peptide transporter periplasmic peptide-binding protein [Betaproteobacteria bacterium]|jgi:peptide/nickel transport system substrate-binding protein|nr:peptide transporter periplasmic peptide-binding protein [Betaproteobacteria bacterium]